MPHEKIDALIKEVGHKNVTLQDIAERFEVSRSAVRSPSRHPRAFLILQPRKRSKAMTSETHILNPSLARVSGVCADLENNQKNAAICVDDFFEDFVRDIAQYQVPHDNNFEVSVDKINESIEALLAPRDAALEVVSRIIRFC